MTYFHAGSPDPSDTSNTVPYNLNDYNDNVATGDTETSVFGKVITGENTPEIKLPGDPSLPSLKSFNSETDTMTTSPPLINVPVIHELPPTAFDNTSIVIEPTTSSPNVLPQQEPQIPNVEIAICNLDMFMCADGSNCIVRASVCDRIQNCEDSSDEFNCTEFLKGEGREK